MLLSFQAPPPNSGLGHSQTQQTTVLFLTFSLSRVSESSSLSSNCCLILLLQLISSSAAHSTDSSIDCLYQLPTHQSLAHSTDSPIAVSIVRSSSLTELVILDPPLELNRQDQQGKRFPTVYIEGDRV